MIIRDANMNDLEELLPIFIEGYTYHYEGRKDVFLEPNKLLLRDELIDNLCSPDKKIIVLIDDDILIGYILYIIKNKGNYNTLWINEFVIKEEKRHMGYGKKLIEKIENIAKEMKTKRIELNCWTFNESALKMYENNGFSKQRVVFEKDVIV